MGEYEQGLEHSIREQGIVTRILMIIAGCISLGLGYIGVFVPVLPTTPLVLLAAFLFAKSSPRLHSWIKSTWVYRNYVDAFLQAGGMPVSTKIRALLISYAVMGASAFFVRIWFVWIILGCVAVFLLWLFFLKIPTVVPGAVQEARSQEAAS